MDRETGEWTNKNWMDRDRERTRMCKICIMFFRGEGLKRVKSKGTYYGIELAKYMEILQGEQLIHLVYRNRDGTVSKGARRDVFAPHQLSFRARD